MSSYTSGSLEEALKNQIRRVKNKTSVLEKLSNRISYIRFFDFAIAIILVFIAAQSGSSFWFWIIMGGGFASFWGLVRWHRKIDHTIEQYKVWVSTREQHLARMHLHWEDIPESSQTRDFNSHPFAHDFNLVGTHSLLQLINTSTYHGGTKNIEDWLLQKVPDVSVLKGRQQLVKELTPMAHFRDRLHLYAELAQKNSGDRDWSMDNLLLWLRSTQKNSYTVPLLILGVLSTLNIALLILFVAGILKPYVIISFVIYLLTYNFYSEKISGLFDEASQLYHLLSQFREILTYLESYQYKDQSALKDFCSPFYEGDQKPSRYLKKIVRIASAASSQGSELTWLLLNSLVPWDMYFAKRLGEYKKELEPKLSLWLDRFYQLEALNSMANFAWLNPQYSFALPHRKKTPPVFEAENLGHPLIPKTQKVTNDVRINNIGDVQLVTGSNMAGKSTYLRTVGINLALCFAGGPVNATLFNTIPFRLFSSINVTDSLDEGLSHFYAEVKHLRTLLNELQRHHEHPLFFMVDEIYRGTNNRERLAGSEAFLKHVAGKDGIGLITTHDLELARLEEEIPTLSNWHFEETIEDGKMRFEYKLKAGPCPSTNALKIMRMEGLPIE